MGTLAAGTGAAVLMMAISFGPAHAEVTLTGTFTATQSCPAYQSLRKATNPGNANVEPGKAYTVLAKNKPDVTHYRVVIEGALPAERWVWASCGHFAATGLPAGTAASANVAPVAAGAGAAASSGGTAGGGRATHVLAMGWEPAFCAKHSDKTECRNLTSANFAAKHLSLHGLWPQPRGTQYCNVAPDVAQLDRNHDWNGLPEPEMSAGTLNRLSAVMPGVQSKLQRHEWIVHGTCFGGNADGYFARAAGLAEEIDGSKVSKLFADSVGQTLSADSIRAAFDEAFGAGAGGRVAVSCNGKGAARKITELTISLAGDVTGRAGLGDLMRAAQTIPAGCPSGLVDQAPF